MPRDVFILRKNHFMQKEEVAEVTHNNKKTEEKKQLSRRSLLGGGLMICMTTVVPKKALAKSRTDGYIVQHTEREWSYILSGSQYNILREGGTERPNSSILEGEDRSGIFTCAGCQNSLFESDAKFHSGTGWPSFATCLLGVETDNVNPLQAGLLGKECRCKQCGGHLGDVFFDGKLFVNTPAFRSGRRYCIDGAALVFKPSDKSEDIVGDAAPEIGKKRGLSDFLQPPTIKTTERA